MTGTEPFTGDLEPGSQNDLLTAREVAELARYAIGTLANQRHRGSGIPFVKLPSGRIRYRRLDVEEYLAGHSAEAS